MERLADGLSSILVLQDICYNLEPLKGQFNSGKMQHFAVKICFEKFVSPALQLKAINSVSGGCKYCSSESLSRFSVLENFATHYCFMLTVDIFMSSGQIEDYGKVTDGELSSAWLDH